MTTVAVIASLTFALSPAPGNGRLEVDASVQGKAISPSLYGLFFEEINFAGDGGLYAQMVRNGSFEEGDPLGFWVLAGDGKLAVESTDPAGPKNRHALRIDVGTQGGARNEGYLGMAVRKGETYRLALQAKALAGSPDLVAKLVSDGKSLGEARIGAIRGGWNEYRVSIKATAGARDANLALESPGPCSFQIDAVSLFPAKTWKNRPNGLRPDLAGMLAALKPAFVRFPGGCWVEGETMASAYRWKDTIGPVPERRTVPNLWGYFSGNGLGFHEYLQMCEDLKAEPLFVVNCGMSHREVVPMGEMDEFVQDALDAVEYANGPVDSKWGALRAKSGHPKPFNLRYMEIGNENGGAAYNERYELFVKALRAKHPEIHLIADVWGGTPSSAPVEMVDEHYYNTPQFFMDNADRYDAYDRRGPKVYVGEYAVTRGCGAGNLIAAIGEAAFMTGMERNSDVVVMASYAPLLAHVGKKAWNPDLINFDSTRAYGIPSYYVQKLFAENKGDFVLPVQVQAGEEPKPTFGPGGIGLGTWSTQAEYKDVRVTQGDKVLFESADASALSAVKGVWELRDGALRQTSDDEAAMIEGGSTDWIDYTLTVKARKLGGAEGFLIEFGRRDAGNWFWWNVGGWGNTRTVIERSTAGGKNQIGRDSNVRVETGRWYDLKVEYGKELVKCYLDGKLIHEAACPQQRSVFATASRDAKTGDVLLKLVNAGVAAVDMDVVLKGLPEGAVEGVEQVLTGKPEDENSLENPNKVKPKRRKVRFSGPRFARRFPAYSVTVMRLRAAR